MWLGLSQIIGLMLCLGIPTLPSDKGCSFHIPKPTVLGTFFFLTTSEFFLFH